MTWSYSGNPEDSNIDAVHFLIGDTDSATPLIQDEEIAYLLQSNSVLFAAAAAADRLFQRYLDRSGRQRVGDVQVDNSHLADVWRRRAADLRSRAERAAVGMTVGGLSRSALYDSANDPDAVQPFFRRSSQSTPGTNPPPAPGSYWP